MEQTQTGHNHGAFTQRSEDEGCRAEAQCAEAGWFNNGQAGYGSASQLRNWEVPMKFFYVYILQSESSVKHFYVGFTEDLQDRLKNHNTGQVPHTIKFRPWRIKTAIAFTERQKAIEFERYLKTASGRAFAKKRF